MDASDQNAEDLESIEVNALQVVVCSSCENLSDQMELYRCSCDNVSSSDSEMHYCDLCIGSHIRKQHDVIDCKGYKPAICATHQALCTLFCEECEMVFCFKCLGSHCEHKFKAASEKARDLRKFVFEYLDQFDRLSKPLAERKTDVDNARNLRKDFYPNLSDENVLDGLCTNFEHVVRTNSTKWNTVVSESNSADVIYNIHHHAESGIANLRTMLSMSDALFISNFMESRKQLNSSISDQEWELNQHGTFKWCRSMSNILEDCIEVALTSWKLPVYERKEFLNIELIRSNYLPNFWLQNDTLYDPIYYESEVSFLVLHKDKKPIQRHHIAGANIHSVYRSSNLIAIVLTEANVVQIHELPFNQLVYETELGEDFDLLSFSFSNEKYSFVCWSRKSRCILSKTDDCIDWEVPNGSKPKLLKLKENVIIFVDDNNTVTIFHLGTKRKVKVLAQHHGLTRIDNIIFDYFSRVTVFDYGMKAVLVSKFSLTHKLHLNWEIVNIYRVLNSEIFNYMTCVGEYLIACEAHEIFYGTLKT